MKQKNPFRELSPLEAIRGKCIDCRRTPNNIKLCPCKLCPLYPFRFGKEPGQRKKQFT